MFYARHMTHHLLPEARRFGLARPVTKRLSELYAGLTAGSGTVIT